MAHSLKLVRAVPIRMPVARIDRSFLDTHPMNTSLYN